MPAEPAVGPRARQFWSETLAEFELPPAQMELLTEICRTLDRLDALSAAIDSDGLLTTGGAGQPVVNPALPEVRGQQIVLHRLLGALDLPDDAAGESSPAVVPARTVRARRAARARWAGHDRGAS